MGKIVRRRRRPAIIASPHWMTKSEYVEACLAYYRDRILPELLELDRKIRQSDPDTVEFSLMTFEGDLLLDEAPADWPDLPRAVYSMLAAADCPLTRQQVFEALGLTEHDVRDALDALEKAGCVASVLGLYQERSAVGYYAVRDGELVF